jgi:hypothetical protein
MRHADLATLGQLITDLAGRSVIADRIRRIDIEPSDDPHGEEFLRVTFLVSGLQKISPDQVARLVNSIEDAVAVEDERYPSIRFAEAA